MLLIVTGVGSLIHIYAIGYMAHEGGYYRFFAYLNLFMFFMLMLVLAPNFLLLFVGWEGVGLCSYLLIGFYFLEKFATNAGQQSVHREPHRRFRLFAGDVSDLPAIRIARFQHRCSTAAQGMPMEIGYGILTIDLPAACWSARPASRRRFRCMSGCRTPWPAPRRYPL